MLWLALAGRDAGVRCSSLIGIDRSASALDFDLACALRLLKFDNEREIARAKVFKDCIKAAVGELFTGTPDSGDTEIEYSENDVL